MCRDKTQSQSSMTRCLITKNDIFLPSDQNTLSTSLINLLFVLSPRKRIKSLKDLLLKMISFFPLRPCRQRTGWNPMQATSGSRDVTVYHLTCDILSSVYSRDVSLSLTLKNSAPRTAPLKLSQIPPLRKPDYSKRGCSLWQGHNLKMSTVKKCILSALRHWLQKTLSKRLKRTVRHLNPNVNRAFPD